MRIVSRFHDYYDIGLNLGYDSHVDFIRTPREIDFSKDLSLEDRATRDFFRGLKLPWRHSSGFGMEYIVIGFCGTFYPLIIKHRYGAPSKYCYSFEELSSIMKIDRYNSYKGFYETVKSLKNDELFLTNRSPIIIVTHGAKAVWNGLLRNYQFARIVDPYQAFQRIEMFLGNLAAPEKPIPPRTDVEKLQSHGFDKKISFRKGKKS